MDHVFCKFTRVAGQLWSLWRIPCPKCGHQLQLRDSSLLGQAARCPECSFEFLLEERAKSQRGVESLSGRETIAAGNLAESLAELSTGREPILKEFGRYHLLRELGQGAMGTVYLAHDVQLGRQVALKIPKFGSSDDSESLERFYREARSAATLRHPNICPVFDVGEVDGAHYLTMTFIEGRTLSSYINHQSEKTERQVVGIVRKLASALDHAHRQGVVHRDLKPGNIMIDKRNDPIVMDFGLALQLDKGNDRLTQTGTILGTPHYMSPEQIRAEWDRVGPCSDIYSLGVILYGLLTGEIPFDGPIGVVMARVLTEEPRKPSEFRADLDPRLEATCLQMIAKEIETRYQSMREVDAALVGFLKRPKKQVSEPMPVEPASTTSVPTKKDKSKSQPRVTSRQSRRTVPVQGGDNESQQRDAGRSTSMVENRRLPPRILLGKQRGKSSSRKKPKAARTGWLIPGAVILCVSLGLVTAAVTFFLNDGDESGSNEPATDSVAASSQDDEMKSVVPKANGRPPVDNGTPDEDLPADTRAVVKNSIGMQFVLIPAGQFRMGSGNIDRYAREYERPYHRVRITKPFYLSVFEVTQHQYAEVMGVRPWQGKQNVQDGPDYPATHVSWNDAVEFCRKLSEQEGVEYRLPTEAEWEYSCRAETYTEYSFDDDWSTLRQYAWYKMNASDVGENYAHRVGQKLPNPWGLYDMHGNVCEWCQDRYAPYSRKPLTDPKGPAQGTKGRVFRGGSFNSSWRAARSASRSTLRPDAFYQYTGFRPARTYR